MYHIFAHTPIWRPSAEKLGHGNVLDRGDRPSPKESATLFDAGHQMQGQDGKMWHIIVTSKGHHRWSRISKMADGGETTSKGIVVKAFKTENSKPEEHSFSDLAKAIKEAEKFDKKGYDDVVIYKDGELVWDISEGLYKKADGGKAGKGKYYSVGLYYKDEPKKNIEGYIIKEGIEVEDSAEDENIFFYVQSEKELKGLMEKDNGQDFVVTSYEKTDKKYADGGSIMSGTTKKKVALFFQEGTSDKEYHLALAESGGKYVVNFKYGRRGSNLKDGTKTPSPVSLEEAEKIYAKYLKEKTREGYHE
jgi:hypothetical protein